jgi:hypothetical protein
MNTCSSGTNNVYVLWLCSEERREIYFPLRTLLATLRLHVISLQCSSECRDEDR